jgi:hypothetical protein
MPIPDPSLVSEPLCRLREALAARGGVASARVPTGWPRIDAALGGGLPAAELHEWWGDMADARSLCVQLAWCVLRDCDARARARTDAHASDGLHVAWIGRAAWPGATDLVRGTRAALAGMFGAPAPRTWPDAALHDRSLLVDAPASDPGARLWSAEQAARCSGVCLVIADGRGFELAATRRLQLAASRVPVLLLRGPARDPRVRRATASACATRWHVERAAAGSAGSLAERAPWLRAGHALAGRIPEEPAWTVTLERAKGSGMAFAAECVVRAVRSFEWEGTERMPAGQALRAARRARRIAEAQAAGAAGRIAEDHSRVRRRGRGAGRMTSRGERWAHDAHDPARKVG